VRAFPALFLLLLPTIGCGGGTAAVDQAEPLANFRSHWEVGPDRTWVGSAYWANRLQDWRREGGEVLCVESGERFPLRTLMLLTREVASGDGTLSLSVTTHPADADKGTGGWSGFLLGAGGAEVDYRISAQVHHRPAADGGLLVTTDRNGRLRIFDNSVGEGAGGSWSIGGKLQEGELPLLAATTAIGGEGSPPQAIDLDLELHVSDGTVQLEATTRVSGSSRVLSTLHLEDLPPQQVDGMLGLVSNLGPQDSSRGFAFANWRASGSLLQLWEERAFGPVLATQYTVAHGALKLSAQMGPLSADDEQKASLEIQDQKGNWQLAASARLDPEACNFLFRVDDWDATRASDYRVSYTSKGSEHAAEYLGHIPAEPDSKARDIVVASLNCAKHYVGNLAWNGSSIWLPHAEIVAHVRAQQPDFLYFAGDQLYEGDLDPADNRSLEKLRLDYLYKWSRWCWSFGELTRALPTVTIPDDHDVYQGNLWGAGGRAAKADKARGLTAQDSGGYTHPAAFINVVHRTQTSHLPDPPDPTPSAQGISVYTTSFDYAGISFAVVADRQWKDSASDKVPAGKVVNGWFQAEGFDPRDADVPGAQLLGVRQEAFLAAWAHDWQQDSWTKVLLSQTPFVNVATIPEKADGGGVLPSLPVPEPGAYPDGYKFAADTDSGGWPQTARNRAVALLSAAGAIHLAGDQHLGSLVQYGVEDYRDGSYAFTSPAIANTWPRRWWPPIWGENPEPGAPHYTGDFEDGFGNKMTVWAVANPVQSGLEPAALYDRMPGYGIIRFSRQAGTIAFECWPRWVNPLAEDAAQYPGWPQIVTAPVQD